MHTSSLNERTAVVWVSGKQSTSEEECYGVAFHHGLLVSDFFLSLRPPLEHMDFIEMIYEFYRN